MTAAHEQLVAKRMQVGSLEDLAKRVSRRQGKVEEQRKRGAVKVSQTAKKAREIEIKGRAVIEVT